MKIALASVGAPLGLLDEVPVAAGDGSEWQQVVNFPAQCARDMLEPRARKHRVNMQCNVLVQSPIGACSRTEMARPWMTSRTLWRLRPRM